MSTVADDTVVQLRGLRSTGSKVPLIGAVSDAVGRLSDRAKTAVQTTDDFVRQSPWQAVGLVTLVGLGVGFIASWAVSRSRRRAPPTHRTPADWTGDL
jgi:ElaB/YqjD/DUF883 family membrane-anchored ribosome-binding protein